MNGQRDRVVASLSCAAAHDVGGPRRRHASEIDDLRAELARVRGVLARAYGLFLSDETTAAALVLAAEVDCEASA